MEPQSAHGDDIPLEVALLAGTTNADDTFKVGNEWNLAIWGYVGFLRFGSIASETFSVGGQNPTFQDRAFLKMSNCVIDLLVDDSKLRLIEDSTPLSAVTPPWGAEVKWAIPHIVPRGSTIRLKAQLKDTASAVVGATTQYGVLLRTTWLRVRPISGR